MERTASAYTDALVAGFGRVDDSVFVSLHDHLSDERIMEFTYITMMYTMHPVISKALHLEYDDRPDPIVEIPAPAEAQQRDVGHEHRPMKRIVR